MKKSLLILFLFIGLYSFGQKDFRFIDKTSEWKVLEYLYPSRPVIYVKIGDTIRKNNFLYHELLWSNDKTNWSYGNFVREDTMTEKVFLFFDKTEQVICDMTLKTGDTIPNNNPVSGIVLHIDSVNFNGSLRHRIKLKVNKFCMDTIYWIDGVGSTIGPLNRFCSLDFYHELLCANQKSKQTFLNPRISNCDSFRVSSQKINSSFFEVSFFPNPAKNSLTIKKNNFIGHNNLIEFYSIQGQLLYKTQFESELKMDISDWEYGSYVLVIKDEKGQRLERKIIIKE